MFSVTQHPVPYGVRLSFTSGEQPLQFRQVIDYWVHSPEFREWFNGVLASVEFDSFRWETPGITTATSDRAFECVVFNSPGLAPRPDRSAFAAHFSAAAAVSFPNLGRNAVLVAPCPVAEPDCYGHLAAFDRKAPPQQRDELWKLTGQAMQQRLSARPVWLSTAGAGVSWLHVRLDDRPKYYSWAPYKAVPQS